MSALIASVAAAAALTNPGYSAGYFDDGIADRNVAVPPPYVFDRAQNWSVVPEVGRPWIPGNLVVGGAPSLPPVAWGAPGPISYGAFEHDFRGVPVRVGNVQFAVSPWVRIDGNGSLATTERARRTWLRENGYTAGTRTFGGLGLDADNRQSSLDEMTNQPGWQRIRIETTRPSFEVRLDDDARIVTEPAGEMRIVSKPTVATDAATEVASID